MLQRAAGHLSAEGLLWARSRFRNALSQAKCRGHQPQEGFGLELLGQWAVSCDGNETAVLTVKMMDCANNDDLNVSCTLLACALYVGMDRMSSLGI